MNINVLELWLGTESKFSLKDAEKIRGFIGCKFIEDYYLHHHKEDGKHVYQYPRVQYKVIKGNPLLIGMGADTLGRRF